VLAETFRDRQKQPKTLTRPYIPFLAFLVILVLTIPFSFDFATSVVPGWHTTIYPPYFAWTAITIIILMFVTIGYWLLSKKIDKINWVLFIVHFILTIPTIIFIKFPVMFLNVNKINQDELIKNISLRVKLIPIAHWIFIAGQILFLIYFIRTIITIKRTNSGSRFI
jgi:hypothetical protein